MILVCRKAMSGIYGGIALFMLVGVVFTGIVGCSDSSGSAGSLSAEAARSAYDAGDFTAAEEQARAVLGEDPDNSEARKTLALALAAQGRNEEAIEEYLLVVDNNPEDDAALYQLAMLERVLGRTEDAVAHLEAAVALKRDPSYLDDLARTYMQVGKFAEAAELWGRVLENPDLDDASRVEVLKLQASAYEDGREYKKAKTALEKALFLSPNDQGLKERLEALD